VDGDVAESKLIRKVEPVYPDLALRARVQGKVILEVTINEEGFVDDVRVVSGHPLLNEAAIDAVKQWQYSTTLMNGSPVPVIARATVIFNLK
jgi:protein TonB